MAKTVVMLLGVVLIVVGVIGMFNDPVMGIFEVNMAHNVIHIVSGVVGTLSAWAGAGHAKAFAKAFGAIYGLVTILGFLTGGGEHAMLLGIVAINNADNFLHLLLSVVFLAIGFGKK